MYLAGFLIGISAVAYYNVGRCSHRIYSSCFNIVKIKVSRATVTKYYSIVKDLIYRIKYLSSL